MARHGRNGQLAERQARFVKEYLIDLNATQAAIRAGYKRRTARVIGYENLTKPAIQAAIQKAKQKVEEKLELRAEDNLEQIRRGSQFDVRDLFDEKGKLRPIKDLTAEQAAAIGGFEVVKRNLTSGDNKVDTIIKYKVIDRARYVEMAGKFHGQLTERIQIGVEDRVLAALMEGRKWAASQS